MGRKEKNVSQENTLGARMRRARMQRGISLSDLAKTIGYTKGRLSTVEKYRAWHPFARARGQHLTWEALFDSL